MTTLTVRGAKLPYAVTQFLDDAAAVADRLADGRRALRIAPGCCGEHGGRQLVARIALGRQLDRLDPDS